jgi:hypothetical protein
MIGIVQLGKVFDVLVRVEQDVMRMSRECDCGQ